MQRDEKESQQKRSKRDLDPGEIRVTEEGREDDLMDINPYRYRNSSIRLRDPMSIQMTSSQSARRNVDVDPITGRVVRSSRSIPSDIRVTEEDTEDDLMDINPYRYRNSSIRLRDSMSIQTTGPRRSANVRRNISTSFTFEQRKAVKIIFCYAREDEPLLEKLKIQLSPLQRRGLIDVWHDRNISAGSDWQHEIDMQLNTAQIILLLVSPDFISSDYCYSIEMKRAIERHERGEARVIPVILRPALWKETPLGKLQALPKDAKPITSGDWHSPEDAVHNVAEGIYRVINDKIADEEAYSISTFQKAITRGTRNAYIFADILLITFFILSFINSPSLEF